jgi:hypothetical protein
VGADISADRCADLVRTALGGEPDHPVEIQSVQRWSAMANTAEKLQSGRVFLAGDSAHVMPPTGGFGGNTGVADAHNLAWKLAFVTRGIAGRRLLETYDAERRPLAALTVEQAYTRYVLRVDNSLPKDDLMAPLDDPAIELGGIYRSTAVLDDTCRRSSLMIRTRGAGVRAAACRTFRCQLTATKSRAWMLPALVSLCWQIPDLTSGDELRLRSTRRWEPTSACSPSTPHPSPPRHRRR